MKCSVCRLLLLLFVLPSLTGCWDYKVLQDMSYVSAVGIDYVDNQFVIYAQMVDFASIGKSESVSSEEAASNIWVGKSKGKSYSLAWTNLYNSLQQRIHYGQLSAMVFSQKAMQMYLKETMDPIERQPEARLTPWIYTTAEPMDDIFTTSPMFPQGPLLTKLHSPESNFNQNSYIRPIKLLEFAALYSEPSTSVIVPTLSIDKNSWKKSKKKMPEMMVNGAIIFQQDKKPRWVSKHDLLGLRWLEKQTNHTQLVLFDGKGHINAVMASKVSNVKVTPEFLAKGDPVYNMNIKVHATLNMLNEQMTKNQLQAEAVARIKAQIRSTYNAGLKRNVDVYHLEEIMFRHRYADWKQLTRGKSFPLTKQSLGDIQVDVEITNTGRSKFKA